MSAPLVSVALATCDGAGFLAEQLDSVYGQTWPNLEVVASDDGSTDGTVAILERYAEGHGLHYEAHPGRVGLVRNFERAMSLCRGEFIALCDQDDLWKPHKVEALMAGLGDATLIYGNTQEILDGSGRVRTERSFENVFRFARAHGSGRPLRHLVAENWVVSHTVLFRRELLDHALPIPPHQPFHDAWLALIASKLGGIRYHDACLETYREHPESLTYKNDDQRQRSAVASLASGRFRNGWRRRCAAETARLGDALAHPLMDEGDRAFIQELQIYYGAGLRPGLRLRAFKAGLRVAPFFSTAFDRPWERWKLPLRPLVAGL